MRTGRRVLIGVTVGVCGVVAIGAWLAGGQEIQRAVDDPAPARLALTEHATTGEPGEDPDHLGATSDVGDAVVPAPPATSNHPGGTNYLIVGLDAAPDRVGSRADVIMLAIIPSAPATRPALVSLPRDLWVDDLCHGGSQRINAATNGCGELATGAQLMTVTVEHVTGLAVDHYLELDLPGFETIVDILGTVEICPETPLRDRWSGLELAAGCQLLDGETTSAWVRSRQLEQWTGNRWQPVPGTSDLLRNANQQEVVLQLASRLADVRSPARLAALAEATLDVVTLGERLSLDRLLRDMGRWRQFSGDDVHRPTIPVEAFTTTGGAAVLRPTDDLRSFFGAVLEDLRMDSQ